MLRGDEWRKNLFGGHLCIIFLKLWGKSFIQKTMQVAWVKQVKWSTNTATEMWTSFPCTTEIPGIRQRRRVPLQTALSGQKPWRMSEVSFPWKAIHIYKSICSSVMHCWQTLQIHTVWKSFVVKPRAEFVDPVIFFKQDVYPQCEMHIFYKNVHLLFEKGQSKRKSKTSTQNAKVSRTCKLILRIIILCTSLQFLSLHSPDCIFVHTYSV